MNILVVHNYYKTRAGEEAVFQNEVQLLKDHGHNVFLYTRDNRELDQMSSPRKLLLPLDIIFSRKTYRDVQKIIRNNHIQIVHVHNTLSLISPSVYYAARSCHVPVVQTIHNFRLLCPAATFYRDGRVCDRCVHHLFRAVPCKCYRGSLLSTLGLAAMVELHKRIGTWGRIYYICLTEFNKRQLLRMNTKRRKYIAADRVFVKPNFAFSHHTVIPFEERKNQVIYAGRLDESKGIRYLMEAWRYVKGYELLVFGTGELENWCKDYIRENRITNIRMMGVIGSGDLEAYTAGAKARILPTQWYEGFPMASVEAFACGTPLLGSDIGNVNDIIEEGVNGLHFKHDDPKDIARAVNELRDMTEGAEKCANERYSAETNYRMLMEIYGSCIGSSGDGGQPEQQEDPAEIPVCNILGVHIAAIDMQWLLRFTEKNLPKLSGEYLCASNVHTTVMAYEDPAYLAVQNGGIMAIPDGGPLSTVGRWRGFPRMRRVTGPSYMDEILAVSVERGYRHFFFGSTEDTLVKMQKVLMRQYPGLQIAGMYSPPFRTMTEEEDAAAVRMINDAAPDFVWVGLGAPKQEYWMAAHRGRVKGFMVGVGAGFDYLAGNLRRAPKWMQDLNLEWFYRMLQDPKRLFYRYFHSNIIFIRDAVIRRK